MRFTCHYSKRHVILRRSKCHSRPPSSRHSICFIENADIDALHARVRPRRPPTTKSAAQAHHGHIAKAADDQKGKEEEQDEKDDGEAPIGVVVNARRRYFITRANGLLDMLKAQRLRAERAPRNLKHARQ